MNKGLLLINLGTPQAPCIPEVRRYLREFLSDPRVIDLPLPLRALLLYGTILPFRPKISAKAYQAIWTTEGSPLLVHCQNLVAKLQAKLQGQVTVALGMRYGQPSIASALEQLAGCREITVLPLYPQYSSAATGSSIEKTLSLLSKASKQPTLHIIHEFYQHPSFINALAQSIKPYLAKSDFLLFSYHGIPVRQLKRQGCETVCAEACPIIARANPYCYRAQCYQTSREIAQSLAISEASFGVSFQSRLGKTPWIHPYTDLYLAELAQRGIKRLAVACPSFVTDCLETLEEIAIRAKEQWLHLGGESLDCIPCLNDSDLLVKAILDICAITI